ncbi:hypothetical protein JTB14_000329 [Gonioctena quinquepunctata]|nr:hypothetical protein JTB14_000329 [Gonioctena quinquepunctata]
MRQAVEEVLEGRMGYLKASGEYEVPRTTIEARVKKMKQDVLNREDSAKKELGHHKHVFSPAQEKELNATAYLIDSIRTRRRLVKHGCMPFSIGIRISNFDLLSRPHSLGQWVSITGVHSLLTEMMEKYKVPPERIYNVDETGIMIVPKNGLNVYHCVENDKWACLSSAERGVLVTVEICMGAGGAFMPPLFVFPRARAKPELLDDNPPGSTAHYHPSGNLGKDHTPNLKSYSGKRVTKESMRMVYFHDSTVAIVELGPNKLLLNCELIEIFNPGEIYDVLGELKPVARPVGITFDEMITLMSQCKQLEEIKRSIVHEELLKNESLDVDQGRGMKNPFTILSGIIPGTKWCGAGDIAKDYFDLGVNAAVDACCRAHDLCPAKILPNKEKYNVINNSLYTKSHCKCDDGLFNCLKALNNSNTANIVGTLFFNVVQVSCIEDTNNGKRFRTARNNF